MGRQLKAERLAAAEQAPHTTQRQQLTVCNSTPNVIL